MPTQQSYGNRKETGNGNWNIMQLIGYSSKMTLESNADNIVDKILGENYRIREMLKEGDLRLPC